MALVIAQRFPLGRFHATRWNQNPFEDLYGEWPPSPWRLLRALAARWFQYARETGDSNEGLRDDLLCTLSSFLPAFQLPGLTWRGQAIRQYQPTQVEWSDKSKNKAAYKRSGTTLVLDQYRALPPDEAVLWIWDPLILSKSHTALLQELLRRILYFGRAESFCRFELSDITNLKPNCLLRSQGGSGPPVLVPMPNPDLKILLAATDDKLVAHRRIPPGATWYYASLPPRPSTQTKILHKPAFPINLNVVQLAVGGRVFPPYPKWVKVIERFRGRVLRIRAQQLTADTKATFRDLSPDYCDKLSLLSGKDGDGQPLRNNEHAYFCFWPDKNGLPTRLICWRTTPFTADETEALLAASEHTYTWEYGNADWRLRMMPLPFETPMPPGFFTPSDTWVSVTPFVPPGNRRRFRSNGRERLGERPERLVEKLLYKCGYPSPDHVEILDGSEQIEWVVLHTTRKERMDRLRERTSIALPGYRIRISFAAPVEGPLALGHSAHFGLGLFAPQD